MIGIDNLSVHFGGVVALDSVTFNLSDPIIGLIGPNGAGKTTLTNALSGFVDITAGSVSVDGRVLNAVAPHQRARWGVARSFQKVQMVPELNVEAHLATVLDTRKMTRQQTRLAIDRALDFVGISEARQVSGSELDPYQRRMTEIARCLVSEPRIVLLDEPGGGLAGSEMQEMHRVIAGIHDEFGSQVLLVDHDMDLIRDVCNVVVVLNFGQLIAVGTTDIVLNDDKVRTAYLGR